MGYDFDMYRKFKFDKKFLVLLMDMNLKIF